MNSQRALLLSGRSTCSWSRSFLGLTLLLIALLALGSCGGGGDESSSGATDPVVASCQGAIFIQAPVEAIDVNSQTLTLLGLTIHVDDFTRFHDANLADLAVGNYVDMRGDIDVDDAIVANCLERESARDEVKLRGPVDADGIAESRLFILGLEVQISANTVFEAGSLTQAGFFTRVQPGDLVAVRGRQLGSILAEAIQFDAGGGSSSDLDDDDDDGLVDDDDDDD